MIIILKTEVPALNKIRIKINFVAHLITIYEAVARALNNIILKKGFL